VAGVFVTGTGTDVGKTFVTAALVRHLRNAGKMVDAFKPVVSGFDPDKIAGSDPDVLLSALGRPSTMEDVQRISPWRFTAPLSPDLAAQHEGRVLNFSELVHFTRDVLSAPGTIFIEGVGGIMVPLDQIHTVLDWMSAVRVPVLVVAGSYLGTISHTLTALHVLAHRNIDIAGVVVSESAAPGASLEQTVAAIARFAVSIDVIGLPRLPPDAPEPSELLSRTVRWL
jgi:dethiobiotin synthetase